MTQEHPANPPSAISERDRKIERSREFAEALDSSVLPPSPPGQTRQPHSREAGARRLNAELSLRMDALRMMSEPRSDLPPALAKFGLLRKPSIKRALLSIFNYMSRPSRTQALLVAECLELIADEFQRNHTHDRDDA